LPLLIEDIRVRSLLDAPCGDFNWMRHVKLRLREYIGVDVLSQLVARNQQNFGGPHRRFLYLPTFLAPALVVPIWSVDAPQPVRSLPVCLSRSLLVLLDTFLCVTNS
jgi:hypothetical protein